MTTTFAAQSSSTADGVAFKRTLTNIPYAREIFSISQEISPLSECDLERSRATGLAPFFEARYLMTDRELRKSRVTRVLELASGLSPRGLIMTNENPVMRYFEIDLREKMALKRKVVKELGQRHGIPWNQYNLLLESGNVARIDELRFYTNHWLLSGAPVAVVCEGLLRYINFEDKTSMAKEIHALLEREGGCWITPDIECLDAIPSIPGLEEKYDRMARETGMDVRPNLFENERHALDFFNAAGFQITKYPLAEMTEYLASPRRLGLSPEEVRRDLQGRFAYVLQPASRT